jgi:hypothetical protein
MQHDESSKKKMGGNEEKERKKVEKKIQTVDKDREKTVNKIRAVLKDVSVPLHTCNCVSADGLLVIGQSWSETSHYLDSYDEPDEDVPEKKIYINYEPTRILSSHRKKLIKLHKQLVILNRKQEKVAAESRSVAKEQYQVGAHRERCRRWYLSS